MKTTIKPTTHNSKVHLLIAATVIGFGLATQPSSLLAQGTAFTYQGRLDTSGPALAGSLTDAVARKQGHVMVPAASRAQRNLLSCRTTILNPIN